MTQSLNNFSSPTGVFVFLSKVATEATISGMGKAAEFVLSRLFAPEFPTPSPTHYSGKIPSSFERTEFKETALAMLEEICLDYFYDEVESTED